MSSFMDAQPPQDVLESNNKMTDEIIDQISKMQITDEQSLENQGKKPNSANRFVC